MIGDPVFFRDLAYILVAAVLGGGLAWRARQPLILGYVLGGLLISPLTPGPSVSDVRRFELFAEIGVILLMFSIGIELSLRDLLRVKWVAIVGGPLGMLLSIALTFGVGTLLGWPPIQGLVVGMVVSVASTMVMARLLMDRGELHSRHGRIMVGIALVEDIAVVVLIVLIPVLGTLDSGRLLAAGRAAGSAVLLLVPLFYLAAKVVPRLFRVVARTRNEEIFLLVALALAVGTAALTQAVGLSLALGAFLAGLLINQSDYAHQALARLLPVRDVFVALFFLTIGAIVNPWTVFAHLELLATIVGLVVVGNFLIWTAVVRVFGYPLPTALMVALGLTQIGEFSFILIQVARNAGHVGDDVYNATLAASLITILTNAALMRIVPGWIGRVQLARAAVSAAAEPRPGLADHIVLCGFGRVGSAVAEAFETFARPYVAIEVDPEIVKGLRARGIPCVYGDAADRRILEVAGAAHAALAVIALPEAERVYLAVNHLRVLNPGVPILARAHDPGARDRLLQAGASEVIQPELEAASTLIRHALRRLAVPRDAVLDYLDRFRRAMEVGDDLPAETLPGVKSIVIPLGGLADQSLREARIRERFGVTVLSIERRGAPPLLHPSAETVVRRGDTVHVFGLPEQIDAFVSAAAAGASPPRPTERGR
jgi:CPA2 family monovalent cation:H+ antiporter-2